MTKENQDSQQEDIWFCANGEVEGKPLLLRARKHVPDGVVESQYPTRLTIYWPYEPANEHGLPDSETNEAQDLLEYTLDKLDSPGTGFLMLVVIGNGNKEWHWYVADAGEWFNRFNELLSEHAVFPVSLEKIREPDWAFYHDFLSSVNWPGEAAS